MRGSGSRGKNRVDPFGECLRNHIGHSGALNRANFKAFMGANVRVDMQLSRDPGPGSFSQELKGSFVQERGFVGAQQPGTPPHTLAFRSEWSCPPNDFTKLARLFRGQPASPPTLPYPNSDSKKLNKYSAFTDDYKLTSFMKQNRSIIERNPSVANPPLFIFNEDTIFIMH